MTLGAGFSGFSRSTDGGATWVDGGAFPSGAGSANTGDPSMTWRRLDGYFYYAALHAGGLGLWRSTDDCSTFTWVGKIHVGTNDDKELMAIDNTPTSPYYGLMHVAWTNFSDGRIYETYSADGGTIWSAPVALSAAGLAVQGAWPTVAANGDIFVAWVYWQSYPAGPIDIQIVRSTNGGTSFAVVTNPLTGGINPRASAPTTTCSRPALNGNIRYLPSPQITVSPNGNLHVVYSRDPDGYNTGDVVNVYYRRSTDSGATWGSEVLLNDDATTTDQFFPTVSAGPTGRIVATWYDRRLDANNLLFDYYMRVSHDGGATWQPSQRVSDVSSPIYLDPSLNTCYHGDYDQQIQDAGKAYIQWSDDRNVQSGHQDPDIWSDSQTFTPDFTLTATPATQNVCAPANATVNVAIGSVLGFADPVTLSAIGNPAGTTTGFSVNPVTPAGASVLTIGSTGAAAAGSYTIQVDGAAGALTHANERGDDAVHGCARRAGLTAPANGTKGVSPLPTLTWGAVPQASTYSIQIATDAAFASIVASASGLTGTSYTPGAALASNALYYWRVWADNTCGTGTNSATFAFVTASLATVNYCSSPALAIPDNTPAGVFNNQVLAAAGSLVDLNVSVNTTHTWVGDLIFTLQNVGTATSVTIVDRPGRTTSGAGCGGNDINATLDDEAASPVENQCAAGVPTINGTFSPTIP